MEVRACPHSEDPGLHPRKDPGLSLILPEKPTSSSIRDSKEGQVRVVGRARQKWRAPDKNLRDRSNLRLAGEGVQGGQARMEDVDGE